MNYLIKYPLTPQGPHDILYRASVGEQEVIVHKINMKLPPDMLRNCQLVWSCMLRQQRVRSGQEYLAMLLPKGLPETDYLALPETLNAFAEASHWVLIYKPYQPLRLANDLQTVQKLYQLFDSRLQHMCQDFRLDRLYETEQGVPVLLDYGLQAPSQRQDAWHLGILCLQFMFDKPQRRQLKAIIQMKQQATMSEFLQQTLVRNGVASNLIRVLVGIMQLDPAQRTDWSSLKSQLNPSRTLSQLPKRFMANNGNHLSHSHKTNPFANRQPQQSNQHLAVQRPNFYAHRVLVQQSLSRARRNNVSIDSRDTSMSSYGYARMKVTQNLNVKRGLSQQQMQTTYQLSTSRMDSMTLNSSASHHVVNSNHGSSNKHSNALKSLLQSRVSSTYRTPAKQVYDDHKSSTSRPQAVDSSKQTIEEVSQPSSAKGIKDSERSKPVSPLLVPSKPASPKLVPSKPASPKPAPNVSSKPSTSRPASPFTYNILNVPIQIQTYEQPRVIRQHEPVLKKPNRDTKPPSPEIEDILEIELSNSKPASRPYLTFTARQDFDRIPAISDMAPSDPPNLPLTQISQNPQQPQTQKLQNPPQQPNYNFKPLFDRYTAYLEQLNVIGTTVAKLIELLEAHNNVWIIPMFLLFKRMMQLRGTLQADLQRGHDAWAVDHFKQFLTSEEYRSLMARLETEQAAIAKECTSLLNKAAKKLDKLDPDSQVKLGKLMNMDPESDIKDLVFVYLYSQVLARVRQVLKNIKQGKEFSNPKKNTSQYRAEWHRVHARTLATLVILELPIYDDTSFDVVLFQRSLQDTTQIDAYSDTMESVVDRIKLRFKDQYEI